jgi:hypothetical protein
MQTVRKLKTSHRNTESFESKDVTYQQLPHQDFLEPNHTVVFLRY